MLRFDTVFCKARGGGMRETKNTDRDRDKETAEAIEKERITTKTKLL